MGYKISVIVPIFNKEDVLENTILSVIRQTIGFENLELILVDDESTDNSKSIINNFASQYSNIKPIFLNKNCGAGQARNIGIDNATSEYIMFLDGDDEYVEDICETLYKKIAETGVDLVGCNHIDINLNQSPKLIYCLDKTIGEKYITTTDNIISTVSVCNKIHRKDFIKENNIRFENRVGEDFNFTALEFAHMDAMIFLNQYHGYKYYNNNDSDAKVPSKENINHVIKSWHQAFDNLKEINREDIFEHHIKTQMGGFFFRMMYYDGTKQEKYELFEKLYEFEKYYGKEIELKVKPFVPINNRILKKQYNQAILLLNILKIMRKGLLKMRRILKILKRENNKFN